MDWCTRWRCVGGNEHGRHVIIIGLWKRSQIVWRPASVSVDVAEWIEERW
jgi:hypothetical protein